jgi:hypothetical protein
MTRVRCGWCDKAMPARRWLRHERRKHHGFAPFALALKEAPMHDDLNLLPGGVQLLGTARCSEAEPQCCSVGRTEAGDLVLANHRGERFTIPAGEVAQVLELAGRPR